MEQEDLLAYNTQKKKLILPEYGRNVHRMIEYCMSLEDRDERTRCANAIVNIMGNLFPHLRDVDDFKHKLWDHLAIMSDFKLDIDYPYEVIKKKISTISPTVCRIPTLLCIIAITESCSKRCCRSGRRCPKGRRRIV